VLEAFRSIKAADYFDLNATIRLREEFELIVLVENLFDKQPPMVGNAVGSNANSLPSVYAPLWPQLFGHGADNIMNAGIAARHGS